MVWKRAICSLLICCTLLSLLPLYIVARAETEIPEAFQQKENPVELALLPSDLVSMNHVRPGRIAHIFPDPALAQAIADAFGVSVQNFVIQSDLNRILAFVADGRGIQNLEGMQYLHALRDLSLNDNRLRDIRPLAGLHNLERLLLDDNQIEDLEPLRGLTNLNWLWLDHNQIQNLAPLEGMTELRWLTLWGNRVRDLGPLHRMVRLESLWLADNQIQNLSPIAGAQNLEILSLANNQIGDLSPLLGMERMRLFWLSRQTILLPQVMRTDPFEKPNAVLDVDGTPIMPRDISDGGMEMGRNIHWVGLTTDTAEVRYTFSQYVNVGTVRERFYGTVTQPLAATPFVDVRRGSWFYEAVAFVFHQGLMGGTSATRFTPEADLSRAMVVTVLHRMAGAPQVTYRAVFEDVSPGVWYSQAAIWAYEQGIARGLGRPERFAPQTPITREQFATMLHRYAQSQGLAQETPPANRLAQFADRDQVSGWAYEAVAWSVANGLITGVNPTILAPRDTATRGACAMIVMRYAERFAVYSMIFSR